MRNHSYAKGTRAALCAVMCMLIRGRLNDIKPQSFYKHNIIQNVYNDTKLH